MREEEKLRPAGPTSAVLSQSATRARVDEQPGRISSGLRTVQETKLLFHEAVSSARIPAFVRS